MKNKTILIAEDKDFLQRIIEAYVPSDMDSVCCSTGEEALMSALSANVAIISDNVIGYEQGKLLEKFTELHKEIPVVVITSDNSSITRIKYLKNGAADVITKPFNPEELMLRVIRLVK